MYWADIEVPNNFVDKVSRKLLACYPYGTFYPMSDDPSIKNHQITTTDFRPCSICQSYSQASINRYALESWYYDLNLP